MSTLSVKHLAKQFKTRRVVQDVSLELHSGEIVGLLGPNGAGKTTSFYMIVGLIACDAGDVYLDETCITGAPMHTRARLGISYLPQEASVFRKLSVKDNILSILELNPALNRHSRKERLEKLLNDFHLKHIAHSSGASLSGGERRRVEIARALATNPKFILLDEPFAGVDPISVIDIKEIIHDLSRLGIGVLITDHNVQETLTICSRTYIVHQGQILAEGDKNTILANEHVRKVYLGENFTLNAEENS